MDVEIKAHKIKKSAWQVHAVRLRDLSPKPFSSGQFSCSVMSNSLQPHRLQHARLPCPITNSRSLLRPVSIESVMPSNHLILCHPLLFLPSIFPSIRVFFNESFLHIRWPKYWSFSFSIFPSSDYSGLISEALVCSSKMR